MKFFVPVMTLALMSPLANAQTFNVKKVKGKQAIIHMTSGGFSEGQSVTVGGGGSSSASRSGGGGSRDKFLGLAGSFTSSKVGTETMTGIGLDVTYGWNKQSLEYGLIGGVAISSGGGANSTALRVGGVFDYNFGENRPGNDGIMFVGIQGTYGTTSGGATSTTTINIYPHLGYKMFALGNATAIRFHVGMNVAQNSAGGASTSDSQPGAGLGLQTYF